MYGQVRHSSRLRGASSPSGASGLAKAGCCGEVEGREDMVRMLAQVGQTGCGGGQWEGSGRERGERGGLTDEHFYLLEMGDV